MRSPKHLQAHLCASSRLSLIDLQGCALLPARRAADDSATSNDSGGKALRAWWRRQRQCKRSRSASSQLSGPAMSTAWGCEEAHTSAFCSACFPLARRGAPVAPSHAPACTQASPGNSAPNSEVQLLVLSSAPCLAPPADLDTMLTRFTLGCSMRVTSSDALDLLAAALRGKLRRSLPVDELRQLLMRLRNLLTRHGTREKKLLAALRLVRGTCFALSSASGSTDSKGPPPRPDLHVCTELRRIDRQQWSRGAETLVQRILGARGEARAAVLRHPVARDGRTSRSRPIGMLRP